MRKTLSIYITGPNSVEFRKKTIDIAWFSAAQALHIFHRFSELSLITLFESKNEREKIEPVPIGLPRTSRNFPDFKTRNGKKIYNWLWR